jgi:hypothetical protein
MFSACMKKNLPATEKFRPHALPSEEGSIVLIFIGMRLNMNQFPSAVPLIDHLQSSLNA